MAIVGPTLWLLLTALGFLLLRSMGHIGSATLQAISVRVAAFLFIAAGTIGAAGWIGQASHTGIRIANQTGNAATAQAMGAGAIWIVWLLVMIAWVAGILPESWFAWQIPDGLSISGLFLPSLTAFLPAGVGDKFGSLFATIGDLMVAGVRLLIGG